jgi:mannose-1-phosphate guanylyltransferase
MSPVHAVVLAGGSGTRFWPASRRHRPKQLLALAGRDDESLLAATVRRLEPLVPPEDVWIATSTALLEATANALPKVPRAHLLAEPVARNTAAPIGWAASVIGRAAPDAVLVVLPADHFIADERAFRAVIERAVRAAEQGWIATIGLAPTRPETGYGYIELGAAIEPGVHAVERFVEKPDRARAERFLAGGRHLWNAGMFVFQAQMMRAAIAQHLPALDAGLRRLEADPGALGEVFQSLPGVSIDRGVMEKAERIAVVPGSFGWNDVGSWEVAWELAKHDVDGNCLPEGTVTVDATNNLVRDLSTGKGRRFALLGVHDLVLVETDDAVLVMPRSKAQDVRSVVDELVERGETDKI